MSNVNYDTASSQIIDWGKRHEHRTVCVCNVHSTASSRWDPELRRALLNADMNTSDGMPLVWMKRLLGDNNSSRVYGPTLMLHVLEKANREGLRVALYGGHPGAHARAHENDPRALSRCQTCGIGHPALPRPQ